MADQAKIARIVYDQRIEGSFTGAGQITFSLHDEFLKVETGKAPASKPEGPDPFTVEILKDHPIAVRQASGAYTLFITKEGKETDTKILFHLIDDATQKTVQDAKFKLYDYVIATTQAASEIQKELMERISAEYEDDLQTGLQKFIEECARPDGPFLIATTEAARNFCKKELSGIVQGADSLFMDIANGVAGLSANDMASIAASLAQLPFEVRTNDPPAPRGPSFQN